MQNYSQQPIGIQAEGDLQFWGESNDEVVEIKRQRKK